jgi:hypothetical protein
MIPRGKAGSVWAVSEWQREGQEGSRCDGSHQSFAPVDSLVCGGGGGGGGGWLSDANGMTRPSSEGSLCFTV